MLEMVPDRKIEDAASERENDKNPQRGREVPKLGAI